MQYALINTLLGLARGGVIKSRLKAGATEDRSEP